MNYLSNFAQPLFLPLLLCFSAHISISPMQTYQGHIGAANITLRNSEIYYTFQVRASNLVNGFQNHGDFSEVTMESTVFVPSRGMFLWLSVVSSRIICCDSDEFV